VWGDPVRAATRIVRMTPKSVLICTAILALATPALAADVSGLWIVDGNVDHKAFTVYCTFKQDGERLTGVCHDNTPTGKAHPLTAGSLKGDQITFTYQSNFLITKFNAVFTGKLSGSAMSGKATAAGRDGTFTANRG
jgi:hypothetical protein